MLTRGLKQTKYQELWILSLFLLYFLFTQGEKTEIHSHMEVTNITTRLILSFEQNSVLNHNSGVWMPFLAKRMAINLDLHIDCRAKQNEASDAICLTYSIRA